MIDEYAKKIPEKVKEFFAEEKIKDYERQRKIILRHSGVINEEALLK